MVRLPFTAFVAALTVAIGLAPIPAIGAASSDFTLSCGSAQAGGDVPCTVSRASAGKGLYVLFETSDGTAHAGVDYTAVEQLLYFKASALTQTVAVHTAVDSAGTGTLTFNAAIAAGATVVRTTGSIVEPAPPPPTPAPSPSPTPFVDPPGSVNNPLVGQSPGVGAQPIPTTDHDVMNDLTSGNPIPASSSTGSPFDTGNFRFVCFHTTLAYDDPTVYPGQPGKSHLHDQTGVDGWNAYSDYGNLRQSGGGSNCNFVAGYDGINKPVSTVPDAEKNWSANRTPYWQPALLDGQGNAVLADLIEDYYKRMPITAATCSGWKPAPDPTKSMGQCVPLPSGLKFIFGADAANPTVAPKVPFTYDCVFADGSQHLDTFHGALSTCQAQAAATGQPQTFIIRADAPGCWDGTHLDSADHRSHMAYADYSNGYGYAQCPQDHPFVIPTFTYQSWYTILGTDDTTKFKLSCSAMYAAMGGSTDDGACMHVDYGPMAWDPKVYQMIEDNCFNKMLNGTGGDLCNGYGLKGAAQPIYVEDVGGVATYRFEWRNPVRLVPFPPLPVP